MVVNYSFYLKENKNNNIFYFYYQIELNEVREKEKRKMEMIWMKRLIGLLNMLLIIMDYVSN